MVIACRGGCCEWCYYVLSFSPPLLCGVNEGQLIRHLCGPLRRWLPWLQARGAVCIHYGRHVRWRMGGGYSLQGFPAAAAVPQDRGRNIWSSWLGCHCVEPHWSSGSTAGSRGGVPPRAETAVYFKLTVTPRSRLSINCEQFNHNVSSCLTLFERRKGQKRLRRVLIVIMFYALLHHLVNHLLTPHMCPVAKREVSRLGTTQLKS